jgi:signal peptidase II
MIKKFFNKKTALIYLAVFLIIVDRFLKILALGRYFKQLINLIGDYLKFDFIGNYNIAFSLPVTGYLLNSLIIFIILGLIYYFLILLKKEKYSEAISICLIAIGALSNLLDRMQYGYVIDYLDLKYFTVFNIADILIFGGIIRLCFLANKKSA